MNLYQVTFVLGGSWKVVGRIEASDVNDCHTKGCRMLQAKLSTERLPAAPIILTLRTGVDKRYVVRTTHHDLVNGTQSTNTSSPYKIRKKAEEHARSMRGVYGTGTRPEGTVRIDAEVIEVPR